jgi:hypothetical protein
MKRLLLDYFRRKSWILPFGAALELLIGWLAGSYSRAFDFIPMFSMQIALFMGAMLFAFDLNRGVARTVASLPLTAAQIGRAWWLATVPIPAIGISALMFMGAGVSHFFHQKTPFPAGALAMTSVFTLLWLGAGFTALFGAGCGFYGSLWERTRNISFGLGAADGRRLLFLSGIIAQFNQGNGPAWLWRCDDHRGLALRGSIRCGSREFSSWGAAIKESARPASRTHGLWRITPSHQHHFYPQPSDGCRDRCGNRTDDDAGWSLDVLASRQRTH